MTPARKLHRDLVPLCNGSELPVGDLSQAGRARREFVAVYHRINILSRRLAEVRAQPSGSKRNASERAVLRQIERALLARDALENGHAPRGLAAHPVFKRGVVTNITFSAPGPHSSRTAVSLCFAVTPDGPGVIDPAP